MIPNIYFRDFFFLPLRLSEYHILFFLKSNPLHIQKKESTKLQSSVCLGLYCKEVNQTVVVSSQCVYAHKQTGSSFGVFEVPENKQISVTDVQELPILFSFPCSRKMHKQKTYSDLDQSLADSKAYESVLACARRELILLTDFTFQLCLF